MLLHKIREALSTDLNQQGMLEGEVHMDGAYVGDKVRPKNRKEDRKDRRLAENQSPDKRCIVVMRQAHAANEEGVGATRPLTFIVKKETQGTIGKLMPAHVAPGAMISADESEANDLLPAKYAVKRVNHSQEYRSKDGTTNNQAESYFSRFRCMQVGQIHRVTAKYLDT